MIRATKGWFTAYDIRRSTGIVVGLPKYLPEDFMRWTYQELIDTGGAVGGH